MINGILLSEPFVNITSITWYVGTSSMNDLWKC